MKYNCPVYLCKVLFRIYGTPTTLATDYICRYFGLLRFDLFLHCFPLLICCCHTHLIIIFLLSTYFVISFFLFAYHLNSYNAYFKLVYLFVCLCLHLKFICSVHELTHGKQPKCKKKNIIIITSRLHCALCATFVANFSLEFMLIVYGILPRKQQCFYLISLW